MYVRVVYVSALDIFSQQSVTLSKLENAQLPTTILKNIQLN